MENIAFFYSLLRTPRLLEKEEMKQLLGIEAKYPFFQALQLLVAANAEALSKDGDEVLQRRTRAAVSLPDPFALFRYFDAIRLNLIREQKSADEPLATAKLPTVSSIVDSNEGNDLAGVIEHSLQSFVPFPAPALCTLGTTEHLDTEEIFHYTTTYLNPRYTPPPAASDTFEATDGYHSVSPEEQMALINNFLQNLNTDNGIKATVQRQAEEEERMGIEPEDLSKASRSMHSTTMMRVAKLHESFAEYESAIRVYEKLVQAFPEKSTYFAEEIERLKALLNLSND